MCFYARFLFSSSRLKLLVVQRVHWEKEQKHLWWKTHCFVLSEWQELIFRFLLHDSSEFVSLMCLLSVSFLQAESTSLSQRSAARWAQTLSLHGSRLWTTILQEKRPENARQITLGCQGPPVSNLPAEILTRFQLEPTPPYSQKGNYCTTCPRQHRLIYEYICRKNPTLAIFVAWDTIRLLPWISIWKSTMFPNPHLATFTVTFAAWDFHIKQIWTYIKSRNMRHSLNPMSADGANEDLQDSPESQDTTASY